MNRLASHATLAAAAALVLLLLGAQAASPLLYTAENTSTGAHADPATIQKRSPGDADALVPLMDDLLGQTGTLALTIKLKDYESAERDLARYSELSRQFDRLVVTLDVSGTDIGEFQRNNRQNLDALATLLNDSRRFEELQRLEIEVLDGEQRMAIAYEGEALRQKMREGFSAYAGREPATTRIAGRYDLNTTPYQQSVEHFAEVADAADDRTGGGTTVKSPLGIAVTPAEGRYGDTLRIAGRYAGGIPDTRIEVYVDSRVAGAATLDADGTYNHPYRIGRIAAGPHLAYATAGRIYSEVATFEVLTQNTTLTLALAEVNRTAVACTGNLTTGDGLPVAGAPVLIRLDDGTLAAAETDENGTYGTVLVLPGGEHALQAEFHAAGYPLNASESPAETVQVRGEGLSPLPFVAAIAAALGTGWYLRRRRPEEEPVAAAAPVPESPREAPPAVEIAGLPPREAATVLFRALRDRLGIPGTKTPRDCALLFPAHAGFFERYERIRYAGETPTDDELRAMEAEARGGGEGAA
ncbi:carboxypeptidase-like regulatory domain-containing protein [Methanoculleus sp.]|uniref:carboxypeptidase-like regulatory domain-containing protein n=1 Tax=Methanoculleus sp. TaxID=90427 RepID=UPI0025D80D46|nr:carboxypeptidase-like regulatory domain-containing protein [Methanoculleus sp.]MCK9319888.1 carboxypeptidase-like regulatory domain-containing protein [Methanoculleus sp.]